MLLVGLFVVGLIQAITAVKLIQAIFRREVGDVAKVDTSRRICVILSLRGDDPFLTDCLTAIVNQDYPNYQLRIVVDSATDPAWQSITRSGVQSLRHVTIETLRDPPPTCGLKNAALLQALGTLDENVFAIALLDADTVVHSSWLRELVGPLGHNNVAVTTGIRWYVPAHASVASLMRFVWNAAASTQMVSMQIPWGGSLAITRHALAVLDLPSHWVNGLSEDTMLTSLLAKHSLRQQFVPTLVMVNREGCTIADLSRWITRQLLVARLYHSSWAMTVVHAFLSALAPLSCLTAAVVFFARSDTASATTLVGGVALFQVAMYTILVFGIWLVDRRLWQLRGQRAGLTWSIVLRLPAAMLLIQFLYPITVIAAMRATTVDWRGIQYRIHPDGRVSHAGHRPIDVCPKPDSLRSL